LQSIGKWGLLPSAPADAPSAGADGTPTEPSAAEKMQAEAVLFVRACREMGFGELGYDEASLARVDPIGASLRRQLANLGEAERRQTLALLGLRLGAYIGETLRRCRGAGWSEGGEGVPQGLAVLDMGGLKAVTIGAAYGLLGDGATDVGGGQAARSVVE